MSHGFQMTPMGIIPLGAPAPGQSSEQWAEARCGVEDALRSPPKAVETQPVAQTSAPPLAEAIASAAARGKPITGREIVGLCKARVKELRRLLAQVPALERELAEMLGLIQAAEIAGRAKKSRAPRSAKVVHLATGSGE